MKEKKIDFFKGVEKKKCKKEKDTDTMKFAKDALALTAGVVILGAGLSLLD